LVDLRVRVYGADLRDSWSITLLVITASSSTPLASRAAVRSPDDITCALNLEVHLGTDADPRPGLVTGTAEQVITRLRDFISAGFTAFNFMPVGASIREQTERIGLEVAPNLRLR
jgi:hypothetical protein